jgi:ankyrin repeat protein
MIQRLLDAGASIDTRLLSVSEAIRSSTVDVVRWLLAHGARANGWRGERFWPLHVLLTQTKASWKGGDTNTLAMLDALLAAGADPNARWDGEMTMLMWTGAKAIKALLEHGADPNLYDDAGDTALHLAKSAEAVRLLAAHGADVNALTRPPNPLRGESLSPPHTPYQAHLSSVGIDANAREILDALAAAGADTLERDGRGRSTLWYCRSVADARRFVALGLDPHERGPHGGTLLHELVRTYLNTLASNAAAVDLFTYYQGLGLDINAVTRDGDTVLHWAAQWGGKEVVTLLLRLGADKTLRDNKGRLPLDRVPASRAELRDLLRV